jgi:branched-chain amino acid aminotransferase
VEAFACGTAAVVFPIGRLASDDFDVEIGNSEVTGEVTMSVYDEITGIQMGTVPDTRNWCFKVM